MVLKSSLGRVYRKTRNALSWGLYELPKAPGLQLYSHFVNPHTKRLTRFLRDGGREAFADYSRPYSGREIPKVIWIYWGQGEANMPRVVQRAVQSWRALNPDWEIRVLSDKTVAQWADISDVPAHLPPRFHANMLRLRLLARYGGLWVDATCLCHRPLDDWMPLLGGQTGFFTFGGPHQDRWIDNWFIAAHPDNPLIGVWAQAYERYVTKITVKSPAHYFTMIYALQWSILKSAALRHEFRRAGSLPAVRCYLLQSWLEGKCDLEQVRHAIANGLPVSKLNWRLNMPDDMFDASLAELGVEVLPPAVPGSVPPSP